MQNSPKDRTFPASRGGTLSGDPEALVRYHDLPTPTRPASVARTHPPRLRGTAAHPNRRMPPVPTGAVVTCVAAGCFRGM
jgi:hypothetical protein